MSENLKPTQYNCIKKRVKEDDDWTDSPFASVNNKKKKQYMILIQIVFLN